MESDVCTEYLRRRAPESSQFETKEECEAWVKQRRCQPGRSCSDGCNTLTCNATGMGMISTQLACSVMVSENVEFHAKTSEPTTDPEWNEMVRRIARVFRVPERVLKITAYAVPDEAPSHAARQRLAQRRLELVRKELTARGVDPKRLGFAVGDPAQHGLGGFRLGRVVFDVEPSHLQFEDFGPSDPGYAELCKVKYGKAAPGNSGGE